jgi:streptogramin lyase
MSLRGRLAAISSLVLCLGVAGAGGAGAEVPATPGEVTSYAAPGCLFGGEGLAPVPGGGMLMRLCEGSDATEGSTLATISPQGEIVRHVIPESVVGPVVAGPEGELWTAAGVHPGDAETLGIDRVGADGSVPTFAIGVQRAIHELRVVGLAVGREGALWATVDDPEEIFPYGRSAPGELVRIGPDGGVKHFEIGVEPQGLTLGPDGNLWFTGVSGRYSAEHSWTPGTDYVGRTTPAGKTTLFKFPKKLRDRGAITAGPDGKLWFLASGTGVVGTIAVDGKFGRLRTPRLARGATGLTFGPEGALWLAAGTKVVRVTAAGQETIFPGAGWSVAAGAEGDIWTSNDSEVRRIVPGAPGIDFGKIEPDPATRTLRVQVACGGSASACHGRLHLGLELERGREARRLPQAVASKFPFALNNSTYSVPAESRRTLRLGVPSAAFRLASGHRLGRHPPLLQLRIEATVLGGPALNRTEPAPPPLQLAASAG